MGSDITSNVSHKFGKYELKDIMSGIKRATYLFRKSERFMQIKLSDTWTTYVISSYGRVFNTNWHGNTGKVKQMVPTTDKDGYKIIHLHVNGTAYTMKVHRLVALYFIKNKYPDIRTQVNHKNTVKSDNHVWNLEWVTGDENMRHARRNNLCWVYAGEDCPASTHTNDDIKHVCELLTQNIAVKDISNKTGIPNYIVSDILNGKKWKSISANYDFTNYAYGRDVEKIHKICKLIEDGKYTQAEIANIVGCNFRLVHSILTGHSDREISKYYDFSKYTKSRQDKHKTHKRQRKLDRNSRWCSTTIP